MNKIEQFKLLPENRLALRYDDGAEFIVDMNPVISRGGVFARLKQPEYFALARLGPRGRSLLWPDELDFCADALRLEGQSALGVAS